MKNILLVISLISILMISCGKNVLTPSSNKKKYPSPNTNIINNDTNISKFFKREDLINEIKNVDDVNFNVMMTDIQNIVSASFKNVDYDENNPNEIIVVLKKGSGLIEPKYPAIKNVNVDDARNIMNQAFEKSITNPAISNISFSIDYNKTVDRKILTLKINLMLNEDIETDIDTNNLSLVLDLGELSSNRYPSVQWWKRGR